jgi:hypothetical protein
MYKKAGEGEVNLKKNFFCGFSGIKIGFCHTQIYTALYNFSFLIIA